MLSVVCLVLSVVCLRRVLCVVAIRPLGAGGGVCRGVTGLCAMTFLYLRNPHSVGPKTTVAEWRYAHIPFMLCRNRVPAYNYGRNSERCANARQEKVL